MSALATASVLACCTHHKRRTCSCKDPQLNFVLGQVRRNELDKRLEIDLDTLEAF